CYKIKLRAAGVRLVYKVEDGELVILVVAVGKRDKNAVYDTARERLVTIDK
ncbi:type II toxin-antitoxin system RelE/ParE family toxin, partial [Salmonella enterica subsp. enterica serovar Typhimurium]|nr:type II toxin-antitoxin system RelE/ParE family toxin [Salmonella enterica subsp. enterica serovar Typhimurium]